MSLGNVCVSSVTNGPTDVTYSKYPSVLVHTPHAQRLESNCQNCILSWVCHKNDMMITWYREAEYVLAAKWR